MIHRERRDTVEILRFEHGKVHAIDLEILLDLERSLVEVEETAAGAVVLTGTGSAFSAGVNLFKVVDGGPGYLSDFLEALSRVIVRLFSYPRPLVAAVNGHAIAGGCIVAAACDHRVMARGNGRIGVTELLVGVAFPVAAFETMRYLLPTHTLQELILTGRTLAPDEALACGLVQELADPDKLVDRAVGVAAALGRIPGAAFMHTKTQLRSRTLARMKDVAADENMVAVWTAPETHAAIRAYLEKTIGRKS